MNRFLVNLKLMFKSGFVNNFYYSELIMVWFWLVILWFWVVLIVWVLVNFGLIWCKYCCGGVVDVGEI